MAIPAGAPLLRPGLFDPRSISIVVGLHTRSDIVEGFVLSLACKEFYLNLVNPDWEV